MFGVDLRSFTRVVVRVSHVTMRGVCMVRRFFVTAGFMMFCSFFVVPRGVFMMGRRVHMMLMRLVCRGHVRPFGVDERFEV